MTDWGDCVARVRGLGTHLLSPAQRTALRKASLGAELEAVLDALLGADRPAGAELAPWADARIRALAGARIRVLERWAGARAAALAPLLEREDVRTLRALIRGAASGLAPEMRLGALLPTSRLPAPAVERLARAANLPSLAALLTTWQHPLARALYPEARAQRPDLLALEASLARAWASRAHRVARRDQHLLRYVRREADAMNIVAALEHAGEQDAPDDRGLVSPADLTTGLAALPATRPAITRWLAPRVTRTPLEPLLDPSGPREAGYLLALEREFVAAARTQPVSTAPLIAFVLRLRVDAELIRRAVWGVALGIPPARRAREVAA